MKIKRLGVEYVISIVCFALLCIPYNRNGYLTLSRILGLSYYPIFLWSLLIIIKKRNIRKDKRYTPFWLLLFLMIVSTVFNDTSDLTDCYILVMRMFSVTVLFEHLFRYDAEGMIKRNSFIWAILMTIQMISEFTKCFGYTYTVNNPMIPNYLFGIRNEINQYIIYSFFFCFLAAYIGKFKEKILLIITIITGSVFVLRQSVSAALVAIVVFFVVYLGSIVIKNKPLWRMYIISLIIGVAAFILLQNTTIFKLVLVDWLKEDLTLNGRLLLWAQAIEQTKGVHAWLGFGYSPDFSLRIGTYAVNHPHNQYLQFVFNYGYPGLILYLWILLNTIKEIFKCNNYRVRMISLAAFSSTIVLCISTRNYFYLTAQIFYSIILHLGEIDELCSIKGEKNEL